MRGNTVTIVMSDKRGKMAKTIPLYQYDYGQKLIIENVELPTSYEVHFSNVLHGSSITSIGDSTGVDIPDQFFTSGQSIYLWLFLHDGTTDGETEYAGIIPIIKRAEPTDEEPTPEQQSTITQTIAALNSAVTAATNAKTAAETAEYKVENMSVAATTLPPDSQPTVTKSVTSSGVLLTFGLVKGDKGDKGDQGDQGETGNPGTNGTDGVSPIVSLSKEDGVTTFSVTDATGTSTVEINDGSDGDPTELIDDTAGDGDTDKTWSADKLYDSFATKASLVGSATSGNFASLDSNGDLQDSGHKHADYATKSSTVLNGPLSSGRKSNTTTGASSIAFGYNATASSIYSAAFGYATTASAEGANAFGKETVASGNYSHAEGWKSKATINYAHAEGYDTQATAVAAHAEGYNTVASGQYAHAEGAASTASGQASHAEGYGKAYGSRAHAEGNGTIAAGDAQHAGGKFNIDDTTSAEIIGNGTSTNARSNARLLDWNGNEFLKGDLYVGCNADSTGGSKVVSEATLTTLLIDDAAGNGDTDKVWSADKVYDQLALKLNVSDAGGSTSLSDQEGAVVDVGYSGGLKVSVPYKRINIGAGMDEVVTTKQIDGKVTKQHFLCNNGIINAQTTNTQGELLITKFNTATWTNPDSPDYVYAGQVLTLFSVASTTETQAIIDEWEVSA